MTIMDEDRMHRTLLLVIAVGGDSMTVCVPAWNPHTVVTIPREQFDDTAVAWDKLKPDMYLLADCNIGETDESRLRFSKPCELFMLDEEKAVFTCAICGKTDKGQPVSDAELRSDPPIGWWTLTRPRSKQITTCCWEHACELVARDNQPTG